MIFSDINVRKNVHRTIPGGHVVRAEAVNTPSGVYKIIYFAKPNPSPTVPGEWHYILIVLEPGLKYVFSPRRYTAYTVIPPSREYIQWAEDEAFQILKQTLYRSDWNTMDHLLEPIHTYLRNVLE